MDNLRKSSFEIIKGIVTDYEGFFKTWKQVDNSVYSFVRERVSPTSNVIFVYEANGGAMLIYYGGYAITLTLEPSAFEYYGDLVGYGAVTCSVEKNVDSKTINASFRSAYVPSKLGEQLLCDFIVLKTAQQEEKELKGQETAKRLREIQLKIEEFETQALADIGLKLL